MPANIVLPNFEVAGAAILLDQNGTPYSPTNPVPVLSGYVIASDGLIINPDGLSQTYGYDGQGRLTTITVTAPNGNTYVQTIVYNASSQLASVSQWVKQ